MPFDPISIREAMQKITMKEWVVPITQRPFVWGDRYAFERAICELFDSLYKNYPIGAFLIWKTKQPIPYREFLTNFDPNSPVPEAVPDGSWGRDKALIYDGQQRLQTIYSCMQYKFCEKILCFDLFFQVDNTEDKKTGFSFVESQSPLSLRHLKLSELYYEYENSGKDGNSNFRRDKIDKIKKSDNSYSEQQIKNAENNIDKMWRIFNDEENRICGYFTIPSNFSKYDVQEIFVRLNTGGVVPTQSELVYSLIHVEHYDFLQKVQKLVDNIKNATNGIELDPLDILQMMYYINYNTSRVDVDRIQKQDINIFQTTLVELTESLKVFYKRFLHDEFQINNTSIIRTKLAILPLILYFYQNKFKNISEIKDIITLKQYFILSQINDWSLQSILGESSRLIKEKNDYFPLDEIKKHVLTTTRSAELTDQSLLVNAPLVLKLLLPKKAYSYTVSRGRLNPEIEHIFPRNPTETDLPPDYYEHVNSLWNLQLGVPGDINGDKSNTMPNLYFINKEQILNQHYDFLPTDDLKDPLWDYHNLSNFIAKRKELMLNKFKTLYQINI